MRRILLLAVAILTLSGCVTSRNSPPAGPDTGTDTWSVEVFEGATQRHVGRTTGFTGSVHGVADMPAAIHARFEGRIPTSEEVYVSMRLQPQELNRSGLTGVVANFSANLGNRSIAATCDATAPSSGPSPSSSQADIQVARTSDSCTFSFNLSQERPVSFRLVAHGTPTFTGAVDLTLVVGLVRMDAAPHGVAIASRECSRSPAIRFEAAESPAGAAWPTSPAELRAQGLVSFSEALRVPGSGVRPCEEESARWRALDEAHQREGYASNVVLWEGRTFQLFEQA